MHQLWEESESETTRHGNKFIEQVNRVEKQAALLMATLHWVYVALGAFAAASLVTLLGAVAGQLGNEILMRLVIGVGLVLGFIGVGGLIGGCAHLFHATQLSLENIREEADMMRARQAQAQNAVRSQGPTAQ
jgi:threonine dehydratase